MSKTGSVLLKVGGVLNIAVAFLHAIIVFSDPSAYVYYGAGEDMARMAARGSLFPPVITLLLAVVFGVLGLYALSGSGLIRRLPFIKGGLYLISIIYILRGMLIIPLAFGVRIDDPGAERNLMFSAVSLSIGLIYLTGTLLQNNYLTTDRSGK